MDLEDEGWVNIHHDGFLEVHDDGDEKIFSSKYVTSPVKLFEPKYFGTPQKSRNLVQEEPRFQKQLVHLPTELDHEVKEMIKLPILINNEPKEARHEPELDQDPIFQVFFKKENQFVETKTGSLRMNSREPDVSCIERGLFQYEKRSIDDDDCSSPSKMIKKEVVGWGSKSNQRLNLWRWGLSGFGAFCCVGMAAATIGIIIFGNGRRQTQKLRIQFYSDNKGMKQVVQQANESMSTVRGVPLVKAQITYGGYYESL
ncbi:uncharacterized protein LOC112521318 [Cynara cardunculus var. scolymus]|uniref:DUF6821 domain-containing protein n=1 Tax=Cynara cardunculus var. scolymus TaxID=59895 RepID=A0A118JTY3_CYNCS|nr:uncharacterized protein LOC112521318 [Cynara cardunculus var. scolymus]KVH90686.1 hypothetical protein Ccrd_007345 [Cynara cardunculus var. scolymus]